MVQNKGLIFKNPPTGWPVEGKDLVVESREYDPEQNPPENGITTKNYYASFDPYQRGRMRGPEKKSYSPPYTIGQPITSGTIATVIKSITRNSSRVIWSRGRSQLRSTQA